jgi:hypothetical protein
MVADALGKARIVWRELQVVARQRHDLRNLVDRQRAGQHADAVAGNVELARHEVAQFLRHVGIELDADHLSAAPALQRGLEEANEVLGLFLDLDIGVADDAESTRALDLVAGKEPADGERHCVLQRDEADRRLALRQADEAAQRDRQAQQRGHLLLVAAVAQRQRHREPEIGNEGKRMCRIDRQRRQHREDRLQEMRLQPGPVVLAQGFAAQQFDVLGLEEQQQGRQARLLVFLEASDLHEYLVELLLGRPSVGALFGDALADLAGQARDADHEELVEIGGGDRQEAQPFQQRMARILRFLEDSPVELQPGELAIDEAIRIAAVARLDGPRLLEFLVNRLHLVHVDIRAAGAAVLLRWLPDIIDLQTWRICYKPAKLTQIANIPFRRASWPDTRSRISRTTPAMP